MDKSEQKVISEEPKLEDYTNDLNALNNAKVDVDIEPDVKSNNVNLQMCNCTFIFKCFSPDKEEQKS
jgi:hypothetical protein